MIVHLATGVLTSLSPPTEMTSAAPRLAFSETAVTEEGNVTLSVDPAIAGSNSIGVQIEDDDGPVTDASKVAVRFSLPAEGIAESEAVAEHAGVGHYTLSGPYLGVPGTWRVEVVARRPGHDDARAIFEVPVVVPRVAEADGVRMELGLTLTIPRAGEGDELQLIVTDAAGKVLPGRGGGNDSPDARSRTLRGCRAGGPRRWALRDQGTVTDGGPVGGPSHGPAAWTAASRSGNQVRRGGVVRRSHKGEFFGDR